MAGGIKCPLPRAAMCAEVFFGLLPVPGIRLLSRVKPDSVAHLVVSLAAPGSGVALGGPVFLITAAYEVDEVVHAADQKGEVQKSIHWPSFVVSEIVSGS